MLSIRHALLLLVSSLALVAGQAGTALAVSPASAPLPGSAFEGGDGDQLSAAGGGDWQGRAAEVRTSDDPNALDSRFTRGSKETDPDDWALKGDRGGVDPNKDNVLAAWTAADQGADATFLYLAFRREASTGNTFLTFELNQRTGTWVNSNGESIPCRTTGDVLLSYEVASGGSPPNVDVVAYRWTSAVVDAASGCGRNGTLARLAPDASQAQAAMNASDIDNHLDPARYGARFGEGTFGEAALNLSAVLGALGDRCVDFGQVQVHSRASTSIASDLKDLGAPVPMLVRGCASEPPTDPPTTSSTPPAPPVSPPRRVVGDPPRRSRRRARRGRARLVAPSGCVSRSFLARVTGRSISLVVFRVDGRHLKTVRRADRKGRWGVRVNPRRLSRGVHRLSARVSFRRGSRTRPKTLTARFHRCARGGISPRFTG